MFRDADIAFEMDGAGHGSQVSYQNYVAAPSPSLVAWARPHGIKLNEENKGNTFIGVHLAVDKNKSSTGVSFFVVCVRCTVHDGSLTGKLLL